MNIKYGWEGEGFPAIGDNCKIHPTALIHDGSEIGDNCQIDEYCIIKPGVKLGNNCHLYPQVLIMNDTIVGDNCLFGDGASVREKCTIGHDTKIGSKVRVECYTNIGNHVSIETQSHITGWMTIEDGVFVGGAVMTTNDHSMKWKREGAGIDLHGPVLKKGCQIGSGAILMSGVVIGEYAQVNAGEVVRHDVPKELLMFTKKGTTCYKRITPEKIKEIEQ